MVKRLIFLALGVSICVLVSFSFKDKQNYCSNAREIYETIENVEDSSEPVKVNIDYGDRIAQAKLEGKKKRYEEYMRVLEENIQQLQAKQREMEVQARLKDVNNLGEREKLLNKSLEYLGIPYVWGGNTKQGLDCSGFTQMVYKELGYTIPRVSRDQSTTGKLVSRDELLPGDLLFFDTTRYRDSTDITTPTEEMQYAYEVEQGFKPNVVSHVGMYIGGGIMIHASSGDGYITFANLESNYYKNRFINARRIIGGD